MSAGRPDGPTANRATVPSASSANRPTGRPTVLPSISHPPDFSAHVVAHKQRPVRQHEETYGPSPTRTVRTLPADDEIIHAHRAMPTAVHLDAHDLGSCRHGPIPRAVQCDERIAAILAGELRARVERESERRRVRLHGDGRRLDLRAVSRSVLGIGLAREIAIGPAVIAAVLDDVDMLRRKVVAEVVAVVVAAPQLARCRIERHANGVAEALREYATA